MPRDRAYIEGLNFYWGKGIGERGEGRDQSLLMGQQKRRGEREERGERR